MVLEKFFGECRKYSCHRDPNNPSHLICVKGDISHHQGVLTAFQVLCSYDNERLDKIRLRWREMANTLVSIQK